MLAGGRGSLGQIHGGRVGGTRAKKEGFFLFFLLVEKPKGRICFTSKTSWEGPWSLRLLRLLPSNLSLPRLPPPSFSAVPLISMLRKPARNLLLVLPPPSPPQPRESEGVALCTQPGCRAGGRRGGGVESGGVGGRDHIPINHSKAAAVAGQKHPPRERGWEWGT